MRFKWLGKLMKMSSEISSILKQCGAIKFGRFKLTSGKESNYYIDLRTILAFPEQRKKLIKAYMKVIRENVSDFDCIVGVPTSGLAIASMVAYEMGKPLAYVRLDAREHGLMKGVEGYSGGGKAVVVDDVATTGGSILRAVKILREYEFEVKYAVVAVDREEGARENLAKEKVKLIAIAKISEILEELKEGEGN